MCSLGSLDGKTILYQSLQGKMFFFKASKLKTKYEWFSPMIKVFYNESIDKS